MKFSIVIPTYNRADELRETIRSIAELNVVGDWELLIVDNRSTDHTPAVVEAERAAFPAALHYLYEPEQGRYAALNTGIRAAKGAIIATTDDDARVEPDWLTRAATWAARCTRFGKAPDQGGCRTGPDRIGRSSHCSTTVKSRSNSV